VDFYPYRADILDRLVQTHAAGRLHQPVLLTGPEGSGKEATALEFAMQAAERRPISFREALSPRSKQSP